MFYNKTLCPVVSIWAEAWVPLSSVGHTWFLAATCPHALGGLNSVHMSTRQTPRTRVKEEGEGRLPASFFVSLVPKSKG